MRSSRIWGIIQGVRQKFVLSAEAEGNDRKSRHRRIKKQRRQLPQASYPCGNFFGTPCLKLVKTKGSTGHAFTVCIHNENQNQASIYPFVRFIIFGKYFKLSFKR